MMAVDNLMEERGHWFVVGDLNLLSDQVDRLLAHAGVRLQTSITNVCNKLAKTDMQRDWILTSVVGCKLIPMKEVKAAGGGMVDDPDELVSADKAHTVVVAAATISDETQPQGPLPLKRFKAKADEVLEEWRDANAEDQERKSDDRRREEESEHVKMQPAPLASPPRPAAAGASPPAAAPPAAPPPPPAAAVPITADSVGNDDEEGKVAAVSMPTIMQNARPAFFSGNLPPRGSAGQIIISHQTAGTPPAVPLITAARPDEDAARADEKSPPKIIQVPIAFAVPMASATPTMSTASPADDTPSPQSSRAGGMMWAAVLKPPIRPSAPPTDCVDLWAAVLQPPTTRPRAPPADDDMGVSPVLMDMLWKDVLQPPMMCKDVLPPPTRPTAPPNDDDGTQAKKAKGAVPPVAGSPCIEPTGRPTPWTPPPIRLATTTSESHTPDTTTSEARPPATSASNSEAGQPTSPPCDSLKSASAQAASSSSPSAVPAEEGAAPAVAVAEAARRCPVIGVR